VITGTSQLVYIRVKIYNITSSNITPPLLENACQHLRMFLEAFSPGSILSGQRFGSDALDRDDNLLTLNQVEMLVELEPSFGIHKGM